MKKDRGERREISARKTFRIGGFDFFLPSPPVAGNGYYPPFSLFSLFHEGARVGPLACVYACICEGRVKGERRERTPGKEAP